MAGPMSIAGPRSLPNLILSSGNAIDVSLYFMGSYHLNSAKGDMSAVSPLIIVSGTWPLSENIL